MENNLLDENDDGPTTSSLLSEILKKYKLEQSPDESYKIIIEEDKLPNSAIVQHLSKDFANNIISEKDFVTSLESELKISTEVAQNIVKEIKEKVVPFIQSLNKNKVVTEKQVAVPQVMPVNNDLKLEPPIELKPIKKIVESGPKVIKNIIKPPLNEKIKKISKKPDSYREPIE